MPDMLHSYLSEGINIVTNTITNDAPELTPNICGDANGFLMSACIKRPAKAGTANQ